MDRFGDWHQTYTGKKFWPLDPHPDEICIEDIAHALSLLCRFGGHCKEFYSVAQHSVLGANELFWEYKENNTDADYISFAIHFLLHDATEAYLCDLPRPIKRAITTKFNLDYPMPEIVNVTDSRMLLTEKRDLLTDPLCLYFQLFLGIVKGLNKNS